jgi:hypothetical protein
VTKTDDKKWFCPYDDISPKSFKFVKSLTCFVSINV